MKFEEIWPRGFRGGRSKVLTDDGQTSVDGRRRDDGRTTTDGNYHNISSRAFGSNELKLKKK